MKRHHRLSRSRDFDAVYRRGRSVASRYLVLYAFAREDDGGDVVPRLGLAVPRQAGSAVERNRIKRCLREAFGELSEVVQANRDYVLIVATGARRGGGGPRPGLAGRAGSRRLRRGRRRGGRGRVKRLGIARRPRVPLHARAVPRRALQVPPELLAVRHRRHRPVRSRSRLGSGRLAPAPLQPVEPRGRRLSVEDQTIFVRRRPA